MATAVTPRYRDTSFWLDDLVTKGLDDLTPRPPLPGDAHADVCIIGAGFTGLWTAVTLLQRDPSLRVVVLEREIAGFGASGRNGGWCSALFPVADAELARRHGQVAALALRAALVDTVDEVGRAARGLGIDCDYVKAGTHALVRSDVAVAAAEEEVRAAESLGLRPPERRDTPALGASLFDPDCASLHPGKLVRGLARAVEDRGGVIREGTRVLSYGPNEVVTNRGTVRCDRVVVATEAWGATLPQVGRRILPLYSLMVATEPLPDAMWARIGLESGETVTDFRHLLVYGQRTADGRLAFGGRGAGYHAGSSIRPAWDRSARVFRHLQKAIAELFPAAATAAITHRWGGPIGVPRDWHPAIVPSRGRRVVWAGGYVGDGVAAANLAGRTAADLVTDRMTDRTRLPWVGHVPPRWEPEPLRAIGVNAVVASLAVADAEEALTGRASRLAAVSARLGRE